MATSSAIPENLSAYADRCVPADDALRTLVGTRLRPAITTFFARSAPGADGQNIDTAALRNRLGGVCTAGSVDALLAAAAADASRLDAWVKQVGRVFLEAGTQGPPIQGPIAPGATRPIVYQVDDTKVDLAAHLPSMDAGKQLAAKFKDSTDSATLTWVTEQLQLHKDDPYYLAAVFNNLDPNDIARLLRNPANGLLLSYAFAHNLVTPDAAKKIVEALSHISGMHEISPEHQYLPADSRAAFLRYLAADPAAAKYFLKAIGPEGWKKLVSLYAGKPIPGAQIEPLRVLQTALKDTKDPNEVQWYLKLLAENLPGHVDPANFKPLEPVLRELLLDSLPKLKEPVPGPGGDVEGWVIKYATALDSLNKISDWVGQHYEDATAFRTLFPELLLGIATDLVLERIPGGVAKDIATQLVPIDKGQEWLLKQLEVKPGEEYEPRVYLRKAAISTLVLTLLAQGRITLPGQSAPVSLAQLQADPDFAKMLDALADKRPPEDSGKYEEWFKKRRDALQLARKYHLDGGTLYSVVNNLDNNLLP
ncbi:hypothetical protein [Catellatospora vulcania]|uniref:hypothetical protein n=1 Tax=Catellatospora vulcania TaxID=1460450 RepID=UPI0012D37AF1|nr:hypothetical protein [Catellatospora vulcania]